MNRLKIQVLYSLFFVLFFLFQSLCYSQNSDKLSLSESNKKRMQWNAAGVTLAFLTDRGTDEKIFKKVAKNCIFGAGCIEFMRATKNISKNLLFLKQPTSTETKFLIQDMVGIILLSQVHKVYYNMKLDKEEFATNLIGGCGLAECCRTAGHILHLLYTHVNNRKKEKCTKEDEVLP